MPVSFLNEEHERRYGRYAGEPAPEQLARCFHLDDAAKSEGFARDRAFVAGRRGAHMRLGFAVQLGTVRFLGTFLEQPADVPAQAVAFMAGQLGIQADGLLTEYAASEWCWKHPAEIRDRYGYRAFSEPLVQFRLNRWPYALCWIGSDRPSALFDRATAWLIAHKVLLPGVTTLELGFRCVVEVEVPGELVGSRLADVAAIAALLLSGEEGNRHGTVAGGPTRPRLVLGQLAVTAAVTSISSIPPPGSPATPMADRA